MAIRSGGTAAAENNAAADVLGTFEQSELREVLRLGEDTYGRAIVKSCSRGSSEVWLLLPFILR
jgi:hypothetical protein